MSRQCMPQAYGRCPGYDEAVTVLTEGCDGPEQVPTGAARARPGWQTARS